jgi:predicted ArsR family transcriptional regulator
MSSGRRRAVLASLRRSDSPLSIVAIADLLQVHPNTVRFHLKQLVDRGQVEQVEPSRSSPGRPPLMFRAREGMDPTAPRNYRLLAEVLTADLGAERDVAAKAQRAGRTWAHRLIDATPVDATPARSRHDDDEAVGHLVGMLDNFGFAPERLFDDGQQSIGLRQCPFLDLVDTNARVICPVHLGLMQGVLGALGATVTVERLDPFVEPGLCLARLGPAGSPA